ncbi:MAG: tetratricopeptide repeat protein [Candidatus Saccharimonadales bacterium]
MPNIIKTDNPSSKKHFSKKKKLLIAGIALLLIGGIVSGWLFMQNKQAVDNRQKQLTEEVLEQTTVDAQVLARKGDPAAAVAKYDDAINSISDSYQKSILTINKAIIYLNNEDYEQALKIAKEAETIDANFAVVKIIAQIYAEKGDNPNAITYYKKTIELIDKDDPLAGDDAIYYQSVIDSLGGVK